MKGVADLHFTQLKTAKEIADVQAAKADSDRQAFLAELKLSTQRRANEVEKVSAELDLVGLELSEV